MMMLAMEAGISGFNIGGFEGVGVVLGGVRGTEQFDRYVYIYNILRLMNGF